MNAIPDTIRIAAAACDIRDMAVLRRQDLSGRFWTTLYYVTAFPVADEKLLALGDALRLERRETRFVRVSTIPLAPDGTVDEAALARVPVIDGRGKPLAPSDPAAAPILEIEEDCFAPVPPQAPAAAGAASAGEREEGGPAAPALSVGEGESSLPGSPDILSDLLVRAAREAPDRGCTFVQEDGLVELPYPVLLGRARRVRSALERLGLAPGDVVIVLAADHSKFLAAFWGSVLAGAVAAPAAVPVRFEPGDAAVKKLINSLPVFGRPWLICGAAEAGPLEPLLAGQEVRVVPLARLLGEGGHADAVSDADAGAVPYPADPESPALIMLTSGSTGLPKAVVQTHSALLRQLASSIDCLALTPSDVSFNWFGFDHVGGIAMFHLRDLALGCSQIHAPTSAIASAPRRWLDVMDRHRVTISWAPNFAFGLVNAELARAGAGRWDLSCVRVLMNAGEAISHATAAAFLKGLAPCGLAGTAIRPAWGMSETCSAVTYDIFSPAPSGEGKPVCVGRPVKGIEMRIVDAFDDVLGEARVGRLQVRGAVVTRGYLRNPKANAAAFTADGWFKTGDLGFLRDGALTVTGRENDVIIVNGRNVYVSELESEVEGVAGVEPSFVAAVPLKGGDSESVGLFFSASGPEAATADLVRAIRAALVQSHGINPMLIVRMPREDIPKTSIGKLQRSLLLARLEAGELDAFLAASGQRFRESGESRLGVFEEIWVPRAAAKPPGTGVADRLLLFAPDEAAGAAMRAAAGADCVIVVPGLPSGWIDERVYRLGPSEDGAYELFVDALAQADALPTTILHCWLMRSLACGGAPGSALSESLELGFFSVFRLLKALRRCGPEGVQLLVATQGASALPGETVADPAAAMVSAFLDTAEAELPGLTFRHVDLPLGALPADAVEGLLGEVGGFAESVALREGKRLVRRLRRVALEATRREAAFGAGDLVAVTGGTGGVGEHVVGHLLAGGAEVLVLGRRPADEIQAGAALYASCDLEDSGAIRGHIARAEELSGAQLRAVVHLAGSYAPAGIADGDEAAIRGMFAAKLHGTLAIEEALSDRPDVRVVHTSSVAALLRGRDSVGYSAANRFVEIVSRGAAATRPTQCIAWGIWDETGIGRGIGARELMRRQGFQILRPDEALSALDSALAQNRPLLFVGLDPAGAAVLRHVHGHCVADRRVLTDGRGAATDLRDDFGTPVPSAAPEIARAAAAPRPRVAPATEAERSLAEIWRRVLDDPEIGATDNFFELGGTSLKATMMLAAVEERFGARLPFSAILTHPTVRLLAARLDPDAGAQAARPTGSEHIVPLRTSGSRPPLFGVHPLFGLVYPYVELAQRLPEEQPFYALQARGFERGSEPYRTIQEMAAAYIEAIRTIQPEGPYRIGGWSLGSLIALEMAVQLEAAGHKVETLVIIDQATDSVQRFLEAMPLSIQMRRLLQILGAALGSYDPQFRSAAPWTYALKRPGRLLGFVKSTMVPMLRIALINRKAAQDYALPGFSGDIVLLHTGDPEFTRIDDPRLGWDRITTGEVRVYRIPGSHLTLHEPPHVEMLASSLAEALNRPPTPDASLRAAAE